MDVLGSVSNRTGIVLERSPRRFEECMEERHDRVWRVRPRWPAPSWLLWLDRQGAVRDVSIVGGGTTTSLGFARGDLPPAELSEASLGELLYL